LALSTSLFARARRRRDDAAPRFRRPTKRSSARGAWTIIGWQVAAFAASFSACVAFATAGRCTARSGAGQKRAGEWFVRLAFVTVLALRGGQIIAITNVRIEPGA
jgi:hypothetical protein